MYIEYVDTPIHNEEVEPIQHLLNCARKTLSAEILNKYGWKHIAEDGYFGKESAAAVAAFQHYKGLTPSKYGILGDTTISALKEYIKSKSTENLLGGNCVIRSSGPILTNGGPIITNAPSPPKTQNIFISADFNIWKNPTNLVGGFLTLLDHGMIVGSMKLASLDTIHFNWNKFFTDFIYSGAYVNNGMGSYTQLKSPTKSQTLIYKNKGNTPVPSRGKFTAYRFSALNKYAPLIDKVRTNTKISSRAEALGYISLGFEYLDTLQSVQKTFKGEMKIVDLAGKVGETSVNTLTTFAGPLHDAIIGTSSVAQKIPIQTATQNLGKTIAKTKLVTKIANYGTKAGATAAGVGSASAVVIIGLQCIGSFLMGWEIGKWIESKTQWGEKSVDWMWDKFLGKWVTMFYEWKINRIVVIQYPPDWTDKQIEDFQCGSKKIYNR